MESRYRRCRRRLLRRSPPAVIDPLRGFGARKCRPAKSFFFFTTSRDVANCGGGGVARYSCSVDLAVLCSGGDVVGGP